MKSRRIPAAVDPWRRLSFSLVAAGDSFDSAFVTDHGDPIPQPGRQSPPDSRAALKLFVQRWAVTALGVLVAANILRGIDYDTVGGLFAASLLLGALNALFGRIKLVLGCLTLGVFAFVMNALLLMFVGALVETFHVDGFWTAFWGGLVISLVALIVASLTGAQVSPMRGSFRVQASVNRHPPSSRGKGLNDDKDRDDNDGPPIIDV